MEAKANMKKYFHIIISLIFLGFLVFGISSNVEANEAPASKTLLSTNNTEQVKLIYTSDKDGIKLRRIFNTTMDSGKPSTTTENQTAQDTFKSQATYNTMAETTGSISGQVLDDQGNPLVDIRVYATYNYYSKAAWTDESGNYTISGLASGIYIVTVDENDWIGQEKNNIIVNAPKDTPDINFKLEKGGSISGQVFDDQGNSLAGIYVYAYDSEGNFANSAWTDASGNYTISGLASEIYRVTVDAKDWLRQEKDNITVVAPNDTANINFDLEKGGSISGRVLDDQGNSLADIYVSASIMDDYSGNGTWTDDSGNYTITNLASGTYRVTVNANDWLRQEKDNITVTAPNDTDNINFKLEKGGSIFGQVSDDKNKPLAGIYVYAYVSSTGNYSKGTWTDESGNYTISGLASGTYKVTVNANDWATQKKENITVTAPNVTDNINFKLEKGGSISGRVLDDNGQPVKNEWVNAHSLDYEIYKGNNTDADGYYSIPALPSGIYQVKVNPDDWAAQAYPCYINVTAPEDTGNVNFNLEKGGSVSGRVLDEKDQPVADVFVDIHTPDYDIAEYTSTKADGSYTISNLPDGSYDISVQADGWVYKDYAKKISVVALNNTEVADINLEKSGGSISGKVVNADGLPVQGAHIYAYSGDCWGYTYTDSQGQYIVSNLVSGVYELTMDYSLVSARMYKVNINVSDGKTTDINFQLQPPGSISGYVCDEQGQPIIDAWVWADSTSSQSSNGSNTDDKGFYCITNLAGGLYEVNAMADGRQSQYKTNITVTASKETENVNYTLYWGMATVTAVAKIPDFHVSNGTLLNALKLPTNIKVHLSNNSKPHVNVNWDGGTPAYSPAVAGNYAFSGALGIPGANNPTVHKANVKVLIAGSGTENLAPTFASATITAEAKVGVKLTAAGKEYADAEADLPDTPLYQWMICDTASGTYTNIPDETGPNYTPVANDAGKYIKVLVTPVAKTGTPVGQGVLSTAAGPVAAAGFSNLSASIDPNSKLITISGKIDTGGNKTVTVSVTAPDGTADKTGTTNSDADGAFQFTYTTTSTATGNFSVELSGDGVTTRTITFSSSGSFADECFIATACFGSKFEPAVVLLRQFRDKYLLSNDAGQAFVKFYYHYSPPIAAFIADNEVLRFVCRGILAPVIGIVYLLFHPLLIFILILSVVLVWGTRRLRYTD